MKPKTLNPMCLVLSTVLTMAISDKASGHFPWLASDDQGHAVMWFGESTDDRTYPMPEKVRAIKIQTDQPGSVLAMQDVDSETLVGIRSQSPLQTNAEISGTVVYGLYHGTKLTYHVEHLPGDDPSQWPTTPRADAPMQTLVSPSQSGGVEVTVLRDGKPLPAAQVKLFCAEGHEKASATTDQRGVVKFNAREVEPGLNAVQVGLIDKQASGTFEGHGYSSTSDFLTATFTLKKSESVSDNQDASSPPVETPSDVSVVPSGLAELPEELTSFGAAIADNKLFVYGGHTGDAHSYSVEEQSDRFWCLDLAKKDARWQSLDGGPRLQGLALVSWKGRLIRIGGFTALNESGEDQQLKSQAAVATYDPTVQQWNELAPLPEPRSSFDAAVMHDTVYVFGGWNLEGEAGDGRWHATAWSLDLSDESAKWQPLAEPPFQRRAVSVAAHQGKLFVIGGMQAEGGPTTRVDVYDPATDSWAAGPAIPGSGMSGFGSSAFATGGHLYVSSMDGYVHRLNPSGDEWSTLIKTDPARFFHRMLPDGENQLLLIGGANMQMGKFTEIDLVRLVKS